MRVDFEALPRSRLKSMSQVGDDVLDALRVLGKAGTNPVAQVLAHQGKFFEEDRAEKPPHVRARVLGFSASDLGGFPCAA